MSEELNAGQRSSEGLVIGETTPYLVVAGVARLMEFLTHALNATPIHRYDRSDGSVQHAEMRIGQSTIMMGEPNPGGIAMPATLHVVVNNVDLAYQRALAAGGTSIREPANQPQGARMGGVMDPTGNHWYMASVPSI
jgi:PhnB protein